MEQRRINATGEAKKPDPPLLDLFSDTGEDGLPEFSFTMIFDFNSCFGIKAVKAEIVQKKNRAVELRSHPGLGLSQ